MPDLPPPALPPSTDAERHPQAAPTECLNCGAVLPGTYCPACGQKAEARRRSLGAMMREVGADFFGLDGRLWRTLIALLVRPGHLTRAYLDGRRTRYLRPFRLYLTASLAFFFLLSVLDPAARLERGMAASPDGEALVVPAERLAEIDSLLAAPAEPSGPGPQEILVPDSVRVTWDAEPPEARGPADDPPAWERRLEAALETVDARQRQRLAVERLLLTGMPPDTTLRATDLERAVVALAPPEARPGSDVSMPGLLNRGSIARIAQADTRDERARATAELVRDAIARVPTVMFVLLPLFALLLKLLYVRRDWFYAEHIVFALHTHAFAFVVFALALVLIVVDGVSTAARSTAFSVTSVVIPLYFLLAQKRVYGQSWRKTLAKSVLLGFAYSTLLTLGLIGAAALAAIR